MGIPVVKVTSGGLAITQATNGRGTPMTVATNGRGIAVTVVTSGGLPVVNAEGGLFGPDVTAPIITSSNTISQPENLALTHYLTANETVTWAKVGGADTAKFTLVGNVLTLPAKNYEAPDDADTNRTYIVQVQATDAASNVSAVQTITVTITDVDEVAPTITSSATFSAPENASYPHTLTANETVTWSIVGGADAAQFSIGSGNILTLAAQDYEAGTSRVVQVRATDTAGNQTNQTITATITDVSEGGPATMTLTWTSAYTVYNPVFTLTFYDAVVGDILTLEIDDNSDFSSLFDSDANTLDALEASAGSISYSGITTLSPGVTYYARVKLARGADPLVYSNTVSQTMYIDTVAPTVVSYSPLDNATSVATTVELIVTFSETVTLGTSGLVTLKKTSDNSTIDSWDVSTDNGSGAGQLQVVGGTALHLHLTSSLATATEYYVIWAAGVVKDTVGNNVAAQSSTTAWSFTTTAAVAPTWTKKTSSIQDISYASTSFTIAAAPINNASASDVIVVCFHCGLEMSGITIGGNAMTKVTEAGVGKISIWQYTGSVFTTPNIVATTTGAAILAGAMTVGVLTGVNTAVPTGAALAIRTEGFYPNPQTTSTPLTVPSTGFGIVGYYQVEATGCTPNSGTFEDYDLTITVGGNPRGLWSGYITATGTPSVDGAAYVGNSMVAAAWGP